MRCSPSQKIILPKNWKQKNRLYYERALRTGEHIACFAWVESQIVGCGGICLYQEMPSPDNPDGRCAYLMNIYTRPEGRKQGIGEAIITWLVNRAADLGISKIYLETSKAGKSLYTKMGFSPMPDMMKYSLFQNTVKENYPAAL